MRIIVVIVKKILNLIIVVNVIKDIARTIIIVIYVAMLQKILLFVKNVQNKSKSFFYIIKIEYIYISLNMHIFICNIMGYKKRIDTIQKICGCCTTNVVYEHIIYTDIIGSEEIDSSITEQCDYHKNKEIKNNINNIINDAFNKINKEFDKTDIKYKFLLYDDAKRNLVEKINDMDDNIQNNKKRSRYE
jgi:hypothetical protein